MFSKLLQGKCSEGVTGLKEDTTAIFEFQKNCKIRSETL
jgi:hypothetical protein